VTLWAATGTLATGRCFHRAVRLLDGRVLVAAGYNGGYLTSCEVWNPATGTWSPTGSLAGLGNYWPGLALNPLTGKVYKLGGWGVSNILSDLQEWDPATGVWSTKAGPGQGFAAGAWLWMAGSNVFLLAGGHNGGAASQMVRTYDPATDTWTRQPDLPYAYIYNNGIYAGARAVLPQEWVSAGGQVTQEVLDGTFTSAVAGYLNAARLCHGTCRLPNGDVLVWGGGNAGSLLPANDSADIHRPGVGLIGPTGNSMSVVRGYNFGSEPGTHYRGKPIALGGYQNAAPYAVSAVDLYDPATNLWAATDPMLAARAACAVVTLADSRVLAIGGYEDSPSYLTSCEVYGEALTTVKPWLGAVLRRRAA